VVVSSLTSRLEGTGVTRSIGECRMPLWSTLVVGLVAAELHDLLLRSSLYGRC
jgi:hypothetical protein